MLFDWASYFFTNTSAATNFEEKFVVRRLVTPASPAFLKSDFFDTYNIVGSTEKETIANLLNYARDSMRHFSGSGVNAYYNQWQYYGAPPMSRVVAGTTRISDGVFAHFTAGCHGTVSFIKTAFMLF